MTDLPELDNYKDLLINNTAMMDVRAPIEFSQGAFPHTVNLPLMNDAERESVGLQYKQMGQDKAIELGHQLVSGKIKQQRIDAWQQFITQHPKGVLYCFRGGLRSKLTQQWIYENTGITYPRVKGGYKALRRFLIDQLEENTTKVQPVILGGRTGTGKTILLNQVKASIDLEGIFNHRGSVFGKHVNEQPSQIDIENSLSIALLKQVENNNTTLLFEDEAPNIGSRNIPKSLFEKMKISPLILLEEPVEIRTDIIFNEYITNSLADYQAVYGTDEGFNKWSAQLIDSLNRIQRRLGGERFKHIHELMSIAIEEQKNTNNAERHHQWIHSLLTDYYDPMYDYQLTKKMHRVVFKGDKEAIRDFMKEEYRLT